MTQVDLPTPSGSTPPSDPTKLPWWLEELEAELTAEMQAVMDDIIGGALAAYTASITAAGDIASLDHMDDRWNAYVQTQVADRVGGIHLSGALTAWEGAAGAGQVVPPSIAEGWVAVANESAVAYAKHATNRLVGVGNNMWGKVRARVVDAVKLGQSTEQLKAAIESVANVSEYRADTIARTETMGAFNAGDDHAATALGSFGPTHKSWLATTDRRTREDHADADGQTVLFDEDFVVGGVRMAHPLAAGAPPAQVVNCRCICLHYYPGDDLPDGTVAEAPVTLATPPRR